VLVIGFADQRFTDDYNLQLSSRRAAAVFGFLEGRVPNGLPNGSDFEGRGEEPTKPD
jgi:outer membrane protein OmpA-like peptidoglycan-associated protein